MKNLTKLELRTLFKNQRKELFSKDPSLKAAHELMIFEKYKSIFNDERLFLGNKNPIVGCFHPLKFEFDCKLASKFHLQNNVRCALPLIQGDSKILSFRSYSETSTLIEHKFKTKVPEKGEDVQPDILIVPFLAFDIDRNRLGYGGGYYDHTIHALKQENKRLVTIGLGFNF
jgi:5,10-methenyltetrahydrofolate synthetase